MSIASLVPIPRVHPNKIPPLLPWGLRYNALYPYSNLFSHVVMTRSDCPPWNAQFEAYFQTFNSCIWFFLSLDDDADVAALKNADALRTSLSHQEAPDGPSLEELDRAIELLTTRRRERYDRIDVQAAPQLSIYAVIDATLEETPFDPPKAAEQSLWPLPIELPDDPDLVEKDKMVCLDDGGVNWREYALPDQPTEESEAARRRIERGEQAMEKVVAELERDAPVAEDVTSPLLVPSVGVARSSGFFSTFSTLLRRRHYQAV